MLCVALWVILSLNDVVRTSAVSAVPTTRPVESPTFDIAALIGRVEALEQQCGSIPSTVSSLQRTVDSVESTLISVESTVKSVRTDMISVQNTVSSLESEMDSVSSAVNAARWGQYIPVLREMSWTDARDHCDSEYGTSLATIRNQLDAQTMMEMTQYYWNTYNGLTTPRWWIGLNAYEGVDDAKVDVADHEWQSGYDDDGDWRAYMKDWSNPCVHFGWYGFDNQLNSATSLPDKFLASYRCQFRWQFVCDAPVSYLSDDDPTTAISAPINMAGLDDPNDDLEPMDEKKVELMAVGGVVGAVVILLFVVLLVMLKRRKMREGVDPQNKQVAELSSTAMDASNVVPVSEPSETVTASKPDVGAVTV